MKLISLLGLLVLLFLAWLLSYHKDKINVRTVLWGLFLQFLFAVIILQKNPVSWIGMMIFALLLIIYTFRDRIRLSWAKLIWIAALILGSGAAAVLVFLLLQVLSVPLWLLLLLTAMLLNKYLLKSELIKPYLSALLIISIFTAPVARGVYGQEIFQAFSQGVGKFLNMSVYGAEFLFGNLARPEHFFPNSPAWPGFGYLFAFVVLPTIIFFGGFISILYHYGIMQRVVETMAKFMSW
ncbi:MAG: Na+ dependent nucleoside transporter N-terminal domain-containing protein, partial [Candidatus Marinimicrobia bacterium]|nr:Na+ dependent nucleoside transporter N-terminal domain-containing protein [Candidatus Neomarinimicrobiota bacterium]